jgi:hypothetical protein
MMSRRIVLVVALALVAPATALMQVQHAAGQNVVPVFEGWERTANGDFDMVFGYMNRNYEELVDIPVGVNNSFDPGVDQGQPTHFYLRRQQYVFRVRVPKDFGKNKKELVWTLTSHGRTEKAYATLVPFAEIGPIVYQQNRGGPLDETPNSAPAVRLDGPVTRTIGVGHPLRLAVLVGDDGRPAARSRAQVPAGGGASSGIPIRRESPINQAVVKLDPGVRLGVSWIFYRGGPGSIAFDPMRVAVVEGKAATNATFSAPGTYTVRAYADDGVLVTPTDFTVTVTTR